MSRVGEVSIRLGKVHKTMNDLATVLWCEYGFNISASAMWRYSRATSRNFGEPHVWDAIDETLKKWERDVNAC